MCEDFIMPELEVHQESDLATSPYFMSLMGSSLAVTTFLASSRFGSDRSMATSTSTDAVNF